MPGLLGTQLAALVHHLHFVMWELAISVSLLLRVGAVFLDVLCHGVPFRTTGIKWDIQMRENVMDMCCFVAVSIQNFLIGGNSFIDNRQSPVSSVRASRGLDIPFPQPLASGICDLCSQLLQ